jgi:CBS domain-containing protein
MQVREVMTSNAIILPASCPVIAAAFAMRLCNVGDVVVRKDGKLCGIVTDRDIVVRVLGQGKDPVTTKLEAACTHRVITVSPGQGASDAAQIMRERGIRRLPVVENGEVLGVVSLGDLARHLDPASALGNISAAPASQ